MNEVQTQITTCAYHPGVETTLRCARCEKPICAKCAVLTDTGYRCRDCVRGQQKIFETALWYDYPLAFLIAGGLTFLGSLIVPRLGFFALFISPVVGMIIAEATRAAVRRRRSKRLLQISVAAVILAAMFQIGILLFFSLLSGSLNVGLLMPFLWQGLYAFMVASSVYYRLGGIQIR